MKEEDMFVLDRAKHAILLNSNNRFVADTAGKPIYMKREQLLPLLETMFGTLSKHRLALRCTLMRDPDCGIPDPEVAWR